MIKVACVLTFHIPDGNRLGFYNSPLEFPRGHSSLKLSMNITLTLRNEVYKVICAITYTWPWSSSYPPSMFKGETFLVAPGEETTVKKY